MIGTLLGNRYELIEKIGEGGMAVVYKAKCHLLNRFVAVKILKQEYNTDSDFVEKFKREALAVASLSNTNIVNIYDVGSENDIHYIVMEYVNGKTLKQIIKENVRLSSGRTVEFASQIAVALDCAHKNGLIHRDIKPHNILVTEDGVVKVTDFGIAKVSNSVTITNSSKVIGSAHYFSPEQAKGGYVDCRTDIYSLGIVMYEMVTGKVPYDAESPVSVALKHIQEPVIPPRQITWDIPESLNRLILKAIEKEPIKRYQTAKEMLEDLNRIRNNSDIQIKSNTLDDDRTRVMDPIMMKNSIDEFVEDNEIEDDKTKSKGISSNKKKIIVVSAVIVVLLIATIIGVILGNMTTPGGLSSQISSTGKATVPKIIGLSQADAENAVVTAGLKFLVAETQTSDKAKGTVINANYKEGQSVDKGSYVRVIISGGPATTSVPDLKNSPVNYAEDTIKSNGFTVGTEKKDFSDTIPEGSVISQDPPADSELAPGGSINLVVSEGPKVVTVTVPYVQGKLLADAKTILLNAGLKVGDNVAQVLTNDKSKDNTVYLQSITSPTPVAKGTEVDITVYHFQED